MSPSIRIFIVDDHAILRMGLTALFSAQKDLMVVGEADDGATAIKKIKSAAPDIILLDLMMPGMDGATATAELLRVRPESKVLILTTFGSADGIAHAVQQGASGALLKNIEHKQLLDAIRRVARGEQVFSPEIKQTLESSPPIQRLTDRQLAILSSIVRGLTDSDIAKAFNMSPNGVRNHVTRIYGKLGAANRAEAVAIALRKHLLKI